MPRCFLAACICITSFLASAQESGSDNWRKAFIEAQADSLKAAYAKDGFAVVKAAPVHMNRPGQLSVLVSLQQQKQYQVVFIGDPSVAMHTLQLQDDDANEVQHQTNTRHIPASNIISCTYQFQSAGWYTIKPAQAVASDGFGYGYLLLLKKSTSINEHVVAKRP